MCPAPIVEKMLSNGEVPKGRITICKDVAQLVEFQSMYKSNGLASSMILLTRFVEEHPVINNEGHSFAVDWAPCSG